MDRAETQAAQACFGSICLTNIRARSRDFGSWPVFVIFYLKIMKTETLFGGAFHKSETFL